MPHATHTKKQTAEVLLERARLLYLRDRDYLSALVLAGSVEDMLAEILEKAGKPTARQELAEGTQRFLPTYEASRVRRDIRNPFNWCRHGSGPAATPTLDFDAEEEAFSVLCNAHDNYWRLYESEAPGSQSFIEHRHLRGSDNGRGDSATR